MQGKGIIKFFLVVLLLITVGQYLLVLPTNAVENDADEYAQQESGETEGEEYRIARASFLDSLSDRTVFEIPFIKSFTYQDLKSSQLNLGLDLKGGMSVVLQVDLREFLRNLARASAKDPTPDFEAAIQQASQAQQSAEDDYITLFADAWQAQNSDQSLAQIFQSSDALSDDINAGSSDAEVIRVLRSKADETVALTYDLLRRRIDQLGVTQPNVSLDADRDLILVELPGIENPERARKVLQAAANLEFFHVLHIDNATIEGLIAADELLERRQEIANGRDPDYEEEVEYRVDTTYATDDLGNLTDEIASIDSVLVENQQPGPLLSLLSPNQNNFGPAVVGIANKRDLDKVMALMSDPEVARLFPRNATFRFERLPFEIDNQGTRGEFHRLYQLRMPRGGEALLTGESVVDADAGPDPSGPGLAVNLRMNSKGAQTWARMTTEAANDNKRQVAVVLDSMVVSAPSVNVPITGGNTSITGGFGLDEANDLASFLQVGRLPARTDIIQESIIGPSLGAENIRSSIIALLVGLALVLAFMIFYYGGAGIVSIISLVLNIVLIFGALASFGTVLTLPGIAGILLTIGMAVDANVIIYERVREELRIGKATAQAVFDGYSNSYSAIIDANVTTFMIGMVLFFFGLGPIKGFAAVLMIGVVSSVFTAVLVNRIIIDWWLEKKGDISFWTAASKNLFANINFDWMGKRKIAYAISAVLVVLSLASIATRGFDLSVDFEGGYSYLVEFADEVDPEALRTGLAAPFDGNAPTVKAVSGENTFNIVTKYLINETDEINGQEPQDVVLEALYTGIQNVTGDNALTLEAFGSTESDGTHVTQVSKVGPTIADDIKRSAYLAGIIGLILIGIYLLIRFSKISYSLGAVAALAHDTTITLGIFSLGWGNLGFNMEIDQAFIAAILTVIGYSINDTVVVFDRIREYMNTYVSKSKTEVINEAVSSTVSRTVITSLTTLLVVFVLFLFGGSSIKGFAFALLVGILVGTYSSIFVATPIVHDMMKEDEPRETVTTTTEVPAKV